MKKRINKTVILIIFFLSISTNHLSASFVKKNTYKILNSKKINVSKMTFSRIQGYLNGSFYSKNLNKKFIQISGIYLVISKDGNFSSISFCDADDFSLCAEQMLGFQTLKKCEKISNQACFFLFKGKNFLPRETKILDLKEIFNISSQDKGKHYDIYGKSLEEFHDPKD